MTGVQTCALPIYIEKLYRDLEENTEYKNYKVFEDTDKIFKMLDEQGMSYNTYKNKLSSIATGCALRRT